MSRSCKSFTGSSANRDDGLCGNQLRYRYLSVFDRAQGNTDGTIGTTVKAVRDEIRFDADLSQITNGELCKSALCVDKVKY